MLLSKYGLRKIKRVFFQFLLSNYSILEVSCLKNKGGCFLEIVDYHSGGQRGSIRIPEGSRSTGWKKLASEIWSFFLGREEKHDAPMFIPAGGGPSRGANSDYGKSGSLGSSRDSRKLNNAIAPIKPATVILDSCLDLNSWVVLDPETLRPTRKTNFIWNPTKTTLRITKIHGEARQAHWVTIKHKAVGLAQTQQKLKAHSVEYTDMDSGYVDLIQHNSEVNASTSGVAASNPTEMEMISHVDEARATGGASFEPSSTQVSSDLPPLTTDASDRPSLTDDHLYVEEEVSGVSHTKVVDDMGILSSEVVRVDLAELENARGMAWRWSILCSIRSITFGRWLRFQRQWMWRPSFRRENIVLLRTGIAPPLGIALLWL